jgi:hypothetical protein
MSDEFIATWRKTLTERPDGTHYDGCYLSHPLCALSFATDEIVRLRAVLDAIDALHQPLTDDFNDYWCRGCVYAWPCPTHPLIHPTTLDEAIWVLGAVHK